MPDEIQIERTSPNSALAVATYSEPAETVREAIRRAVGKLPRWSIEKDTEDVIHIVRTTRLFRFKDDINVRVTQTENGSKAEITSASRVGKSDLGQNPRNIEELVDTVEESLEHLQSR